MNAPTKLWAINFYKYVVDTVEIAILMVKIMYHHNQYIRDVMRDGYCVIDLFAVEDKVCDDIWLQRFSIR